MMPASHAQTQLASDDIAARALLDMLFPPSRLRFERRPRRRAARRTEPAARNLSPAFDARCCPDHVAVIDRLPSGSITVTWSDSRFGKYTEQIWHAALAHEHAVCALTGGEIAQGSRVFRPRKRDANEPAEYPWMILSSALDTGTALPVQNAPRRRALDG
ncbi:MAG: DUF3331 domain-containing protein [Burkholderia gladioli]